MKLTRIYAVSVEHRGTVHISQECYSTYQEAKKFILNRGDKPSQVSDYLFDSGEYRYQIIEMTLQ